MTQTKRAAPVLAHRNSPADEKHCNAFRPPLFYHERGCKSMKISELLRHGAENVISAATLCRLAETTPRRLRHYIALERAAGAEILYAPGGHGGYFLPSLDPEQAQQERLAFYNVMKARAVCTYRTLRAVAYSLGIPAGQLVFDLVNEKGGVCNGE